MSQLQRAAAGTAVGPPEVCSETDVACDTTDLAVLQPVGFVQYNSTTGRASNNIYGHAGPAPFPPSPATVAACSERITVPSGSVVLMLDTCYSAWYPAHYHALLQCIVPNWHLFRAGIKAAATAGVTNLTIVAHQRHLNFYREYLESGGYANITLIPVHWVPPPCPPTASPEETGCTFHPPPPPRCLVSEGAPLTRVRYTAANWTLARSQASANAHRFRSDWKARYLPRGCGGMPRLLVMQRFGTRHMVNLEGLLTAVGNATGIVPGVQSGLEPWNTTVALFACARVVIGFHGAGGVHGLLMPDGSTMLEVTTTCELSTTPNVCKPSKYLEVQHTQWFEMWRSNYDVSLIHGAMHWVRYAVAFADLNSTVGHEPHDWVDFRIKNMATFSLPLYALKSLGDLAALALAASA